MEGIRPHHSSRLSKSTPSSRIKILSLDEQISRLEKEIEEISDESDKESESDENKTNISTNDDIKVIFSSLSDDKIPPLPPSSLPQPGCTKKLGTKPKPKRSAEALPSKSLKRKRVQFQHDLDGTHENEVRGCVKRNQITPPPPSTGLQCAVEELLANYKPTSAERRPFWCRICMYQGADLEDLKNHRSSSLHTLAVQKERKLSFCKKCHVQFNSPAQLKEHEKGKMHVSTWEEREREREREKGRERERLMREREGKG
mmetsp:Transcript_40356/g.41169  ORF Transcript_40356/g.41169 Transcript_40356/m.41169 type:complete len:258 (+) Transcript_40356:385-1158(+)